MGNAFLYGNGSSGGKGADLTVTAPAGSTVRVSKDGKSITKVAGSDGIVVFKGLQSGTWTLTSTDGEQTASKTVEIVADYATSITFFAATINITYPAGSTCTVTDGTTTLTAPDTSGTWACAVPNAGTWTITTTDGTYTGEKTVSITGSGQVLSVTVNYDLMIYSRGEINEDIGITTDGYSYAGSNTKKVTFGETSIVIASGNNIAGTQNQVDVTNFSSLRVIMKSTTSNLTQPWCALCSVKAATSTNLISRTSADSASEKVSRIDLSGMSGMYYILIAVSASSGSGEIYEICLER